MLKKFLKYINIRPDKNQSYLLISLVISGLLMTYAHPTLIKEIISNLPAQWIAFESLAASISGLLIGMIWQKGIRKKAIKNFFYLAFAESLCGCILGLYLCFINWNVWIFAIASLIYTTIISIFVGKCIMAFKAKLWIEKDREIYDNNMEIVACLTSILGYLIAIIAEPNIYFAIFLWGVAYLVDDIGWAIVYFKNKEILSKDDEVK